MGQALSILLLMVFAVLNFSCVEKKSAEKEMDRSESAAASKVDSLKFTSGISAIFQDSKGNYWLGSRQEGVARFDGRSFEYFTAKDGLSDMQIRSIQEDHKGSIWIGTATSIYSYDGQKIRHHTPALYDVSPGVWTKTADDLWFGAGNREGVYRYDGQKLSFLAFPRPKDVNPDNVCFVTGLAKGKNDKIWMGTYAGVIGYDGKDFTLINDGTLGFHKETGLLHIRSILEDSKGRLWMGNNGIGVLLREGETTVNFSEKQGLIHPESSRSGDPSEPGTLEHVFAIEEDSEGNIWFGDRDTGLWRYDGETMKNYPEQLGQAEGFVYMIYKDAQDGLWFGLTNGEVFAFNGETFDQRFTK